MCIQVQSCISNEPPPPKEANKQASAFIMQQQQQQLQKKPTDPASPMAHVRITMI